jgi:uncharacterized protein (DUF427 family)
MTLTVGRGPWGHNPAGVYNRDLGPNRGLHYLEPSPRRIRGILAGETVVDSTHASMLHEHGLLPFYLYPREEVRMDLLSEGEVDDGAPEKGPVQWWTLTVGEHTVERAAFTYPDPPAEMAALAGLVGVSWNSLEEWYEEDELAIVHARDPYHRVDVLDTARHLRVLINGEAVADTTRGKVIFETSLPPRWYIPREDVRSELLEASDHTTGCAYKGFASYHSVRVGESVEENVAWFYPEPRREVAPIVDHIAFYNERVDIELDGEIQERPITPWSPKWRGPAPEASI